MKTLLTVLAACTLTTFASAKSGWMEDVEKAQEKAKAENKKVLLDFTGSDWCVWCKKLDAEVFSTAKFKQYAAEKLILVEVDFPQGKRLPAPTQKKHDKLKEQYKVDGFPTVIVLSSTGEKVGQLGYGEGGPDAFIKQLEETK